MLRVGINQKNFCYIGTLDTKNKVPSAPNVKAVYVNLIDGRFVVAMQSELIFLNQKK